MLSYNLLVEADRIFVYSRFLKSFCKGIRDKFEIKGFLFVLSSVTVGMSKNSD